MKASYYLRAQNFAAPSVNDNNNDLHKKPFRYDEPLCTNNIMFDNRVCRGNTYATPVFTEDQRRNQDVYERVQKARLSLIDKRRKEKTKKPGTPPPVKGRVHMMIQTDDTLDEIFGSNNVEIIHDVMEGKKGIPSARSGEEIINIQPGAPRENVDMYFVGKENNNPMDEIQNNICIENDVDFTLEMDLTKNIAKAIYDEAKNNALSKFEQGPTYYSDPER